jgi:predicted GNAT family N-acyltransferase
VADAVIKITDKATLEEAFHIRRKVFIEEQNVPEDLELDEYDRDPNTLHILVRDDHGHAAGTARLRPYTVSGVGKVERVAVLLSHRKTGLGRLLMKEIEAEAKYAGYHEIKLNAQLQARVFYERLGYKPSGDIFFEAGIPHIAMQKTI